ncbi:indole-3-glycerol phosphate synthase TrpC [Millionella massiliensis]|uniref:indole-3-glycerol phosphate synthase TrpC n=1 Tax=Millionella massiliensis TaxID=1871023 RepID=UPI0008D9D9C7|nr:indole-3-glycerol phosphate synthase TrpC [Millionella massiliensis]
MNTILDKIIETKQAEVAAAKKARPFAALLEEAQAVSRQPHSFRAALERSDTGIIAEFKRRSPSKGFIHQGAQIAEIVPGYAASGATACSILTDTEYFGGSLDDLREARSLTTVPLLRKDFIIDEYQIAEARVTGADVILLIAAALHPEKVNQLCSFAHHLKLEILLEVHKPQELDCICPTIDVVGVNNRNLETFVTDIRTSFELAEQIPTSFVRISESGISSPESVLRLREAGYRGFLMGENFMKEPQPADALRHFIERLKQ